MPTKKPTRMPLRCPMKEALGMMMDVSTSEAKGVRYMGMLPKPKTLKLATPVAARIVIQLRTRTETSMQVTFCFCHAAALKMTSQNHWRSCSAYKCLHCNT